MLAADPSGVLAPIVEHAATVIAAGAVLGTFAGATKGFVAGWSRKQVEAGTLREGYIGAAVAAASLLFDLWNVYAAPI